MRNKASCRPNFDKELNRAFVFIDSFDTHHLGNAVRIMPKWINNGATQTRGLRNYVNWQVFRPAPPEDFVFPDLAPDGRPLEGRGEGIALFLGPKWSLFGQSFDIGIDVLEDVRLGRAAVLIWGWAEYRDVFSEPGSVTRSKLPALLKRAGRSPRL